VKFEIENIVKTVFFCRFLGYVICSVHCSMPHIQI